MDSYVTIQEDILLKIQKAKTNFKKSPKDRITTSYLQTRLESLEQYWSSFCETHKSIISDFEVTELMKSTYHKNDVYDQVEELYTDYKSDLKEKLSNLKPKAESMKTNECTTSKSYTIKFPKMDIPIFSGKYSEWTSFRALFLSVVENNEQLDDLQKLHYLRSRLKGEAEQLLRHEAITASNYKKCWSKLEERFNDKRFLANELLKQFVNQKSLNFESANAIRELLNTTEDCLSGLTGLGFDVSSWDIIVTFIVFSKLDNESKKLWEVEVSKLSYDVPKLSDFLKFLKYRSKSLEFLDNKPSKSTPYTRNNTSKAMYVTTNVSCVFCSESHRLCNCKKFASEDINARRNFAQTNRLCFNCLGSNHSVFSCRQSTCCRICKRKHHSLLHPKPVSNHGSINNGQSTVNVLQVSDSAETSAQKDEVSHIVSCFSNLNSQILLATALVKVDSRAGTFILRSLLDQGSQASFITESAVQMLGLKKIPNASYISGLGGDQTATMQSKWIVEINIQSRHDPSFTLLVKAHVLSKLTSLFPEKKILVKMLSNKLPLLELADPSFDTPSKIDLLLGAEVYGQILLNGVIKGSPGSPLAQKTTLGWILSGQIHLQSNSNNTQHNMIHSMHTQVTDNDLLKKFWELEEITSVDTKQLTEEEQNCEEFYSKTTKRDDKGRYIVKLPFKSETPTCQYGNSYEIALKRFRLLEKRFLNNPEFSLKYSQVIQEYLELGHMEVEPASEINSSKVVYLPHHAIIKNDRKTTKVRVVFDGSSVLNNETSLNKDLMVGPTIQPDLRHIIMNWRGYPISIIADVVKMYRQVKIANDDVDFQRLLWRDDLKSEIQHLRVTRVTFATSLAPYLAVKSLQQLSYYEGKDFPSAAERKENIVCHAVIDLKDIIARFSNLRSLIKVITYYRRIFNLKNKTNMTSWLTKKEIKDSLLTCILLCQSMNFLEEKEEFRKYVKVKKKSTLTLLNPFLDRDDILRVGGRLQKANNNMKHPILIPKMSHLSKLLIADAYEKTLQCNFFFFFPDSYFENSTVSTLKPWYFTQRLVQDFWRRWSQEYLTQLHYIYKWTHQTAEPKIGDIVLVKEDDLPPARWLYGIIVDKHVGVDNLTRVVSLHCKGSIVKRSVSKLIVLPVTD